jgi:LuxR family transcriptional regulator, quorum-sensing system regulator BjaR1
MMSTAHRNLVCDTIDAMAGVKSVPEAGNRLAAALGKLGFSSMGINGLPPAGDGADPVILVERVPDGFRELYIHERFYSVDHICAHARTAQRPFRYSEAPYAPPEARGHERFKQALETFDLGRGLVVPIGRPANMPACVWLAGKEPDLRDDAARAAQAMTLFAASKTQALSKHQAPGADTNRLTQRERDVLQWISVGKTSWEISMITGLSERAINAIIAAAMIKLDAVTRVQAVVNAIRSGEVEL